MSNNPSESTPLYKKLLFALVPVLLLAILLEGASRLIVCWRPNCWPHADRLINSAYTSKPWFSEEFLRSSFAQPGGWFRPEGTRLVFPNDYRDRYFTVVRGVRRTTGFQRNYSVPFGGRIFIFGGSTTYCSEVPDELTWPSQLQAFVNNALPEAQFEVQNFGVTSVNSYQELERLRLELSRTPRPAVCIFYDGINDVNQGVLCSNPSGTLFETALDRERRWIPRIRRWSAFVDLAINDLSRTRQTESQHLSDSVALRTLAVRAVANYENNIREAADLCKFYGCRFFVMLQPCLSSIGRPLTSHEAGIACRENRSSQVAFEMTYPLLKEAIERLRAAGLNAHDLTNIFDTNRKPIFLDCAHVESEGNEIIAANVLNILRPALAETAAKSARP
jgi:lysophospholipase L1-like esterase